MAVREHETVAIRPGRIPRVVPKGLLPQTVRHRRQCHWSPWMTRICLLHCIDCQSADGINAERVQLLAGQEGLLASYHCVSLSTAFAGKTTTDAKGGSLEDVKEPLVGSPS